MIPLFRGETSQTSPVHTSYFIYIYVHPCPVWPCVVGFKGGKALFCWCSCFCDWIIHPGSKTLSSLSASFHLLSVSAARSVWLNSTLFHVHSFLLPIFSPHSVSLSLLNIYTYIHIFLSSLCVLQLPLSDPFPFSFSVSGLLFPIPFSFFNLDFHRTLFRLSLSDSLSFYFFWWQSLISTSLCLTPRLYLPALRCPGLSMFPWLLLLY